MTLSASKVLKYLFNADYRFLIDANKGKYNHMPDDEFLKRMFKAKMGYELDLEHPQTFNEKLQWLKLNNRQPIYTTMVDKYAAKEFVADKIGEEHIIPTLAVWDNADDIDFDALPEQFVLKCNHDSHNVVICKDKSKLDRKAAREAMHRGLKRNYYYRCREWPYKDVPPKVMAEAYMEDASGGLVDYKFFCYDGFVDNVMVVADRYKGEPKFYHFDRNWNICHYNRLCRTLPDDFKIPKPDSMDTMFALAADLSKGIPHVRIDFYDVDGKIYFGEYTFFNISGFETGFDRKSDLHLGSYIKLI